MKFRETYELNQDANSILRDNQLLHIHKELKKGARYFVNKAIRINQTGKPFTFQDFPNISKHMWKQYIFALRRAGFVELITKSVFGYYRVKGFRLNNNWEKLTSYPMGDTISYQYQNEICNTLEECFKELDTPALHNIRLHLNDDFVYRRVEQKYREQNPCHIEYNSSNKEFTITPPIFGFDEYSVKIILTRTNLVQILIKNTFKPIKYDEIGLLYLVNLLGEVRYYLSCYSRYIPPVLEWNFVRADFGRDCKKPVNKMFPTMQFQHFSGALMRVYSKEWKNGEKRLRVEKIISPNKSVKQLMNNVLKESITD